jgi:hypothetical protein
MKLKKSVAVFGIMALLMLVVFASGCTTSNEKLLLLYNLSAGQSPNLIGVQNVTVPNGTKSIRIEGQVTKLNSNITTSKVNIFLLKTIPVSESTDANNTVNIVTQKTIDLSNVTKPLKVTYTYNNTQIKGILITNTNAKGVIQIFTS